MSQNKNALVYLNIFHSHCMDSDRSRDEAENRRKSKAKFCKKVCVGDSNRLRPYSRYSTPYRPQSAFPPPPITASIQLQEGLQPERLNSLNPDPHGYRQHADFMATRISSIVEPVIPNFLPLVWQGGQGAKGVRKLSFVERHLHNPSGK